jgi:plasmid stabilization system protein ParE
MNYRLNDIAAAEVRDIVKHYSQQSRGLSIGFIEELARVLTVLAANPYIGQVMGEQYRHLPLQRFPYFVIYQVEASVNRVFVISVCHQRRHPDHWRNGVQEEAAVYQLAA